MQKSDTKKIAVCSIMAALSVILSFIKIFNLPYGGSITLFSMVPVMFAGYAYGAKWGVVSGAVLGIVQCIAGAGTSLAYLTDNVLSFILCLLFDFLVAFAVLGFAGIFKNKIKNPKASFSLGVVFAGLLRLLCHFITGWYVWGSYAAETLLDSGTDTGALIVEKFSGQALAAVYSIVYNGSYMIPEIIISVIAAAVLISVKPVLKAIQD